MNVKATLADRLAGTLILHHETDITVEQDPEERTAQLYTVHASSLHRYLLLTGSAPADADELLQEGFLRLFRCIRSGDHVDNPKAWLIRVLQNLRTDGARRAPAHVVAAAMYKDRCDSTPEDELIRRERLELLQGAMQTLTERQQQYLLLRSEGMTLREIAVIHGVAVQSVAETCTRAIQRLRKLIHG